MPQNTLLIVIFAFRPVNVPLDIFSEEIQFYELGESAITKFRYMSLNRIFTKQHNKESYQQILPASLTMWFLVKMNNSCGLITFIMTPFLCILK